jgi:6-phosphogluconate dehydrogenase
MMNPEPAGRRTADIGLIGLAVMGENLALNLARRGSSVAVYNRTHARVDDFLADRGRDGAFTGAATLAELVAAVRRPRRILMLVRAGDAVDSLIDALLPLLEPGDVLIDAGNSYFRDTMTRTACVEARGCLYVGLGVSGGELGALHGPSLMPGGSAAAWDLLRPVFEAICARTPDDEPCCAWMGGDGAGHFVKMVHNGIEYGDMQLIAETYDLMRRGLRMGNDAMAEVFADWNRGELDSYLIEITRDILRFRDERGRHVVDTIRDAAGQKGTGKWTVGTALDLGTPLTLIGEAVFARSLSSAKDQRLITAARLGDEIAPYRGDPQAFIDDLRQALFAAKIVSYAQGYELLRAGAQAHGWTFRPDEIARVWRGGCIIRARLLADIQRAYARDPDLRLLFLDPYFADAMTQRLAAWRRVVSAAVLMGIPVPCLGAALAWFDASRAARLPANLLQAQRDYFGAHGYELENGPRGQFQHTNWTGSGGDTTSQAYSA